jgi:hypothetical protein
VAWRYRRSARLPFGFRLNASKSGIGFSWGFRGFRMGRDPKGRIIRTISIPGTGIYNRQVIRSAPKDTIVKSDPANNSSGSLLHAILVIFSILFVLALVSGATRLAIFAFIAGALAFLVTYGQRKASRRLVNPAVSAAFEHPAEPIPRNGVIRNPEVRAPLDAPTQFASSELTSLDAIATEVKVTLDQIEPTLKEQLRSMRAASAARGFLEADIACMIARTGFDGSKYSARAVDLNLYILRRLHPKSKWGSIDHEAMAGIMAEIIQQHRDFYLPQELKPSTLVHFELYDSAHGTKFASVAAKIFLKVASAAATENGAIAEEKSVILQQLALACSE